jgi:hypothetical protein
MAFVAFAGAVSGTGSAAFAGPSQILFVAVDLDVLGLGVRLTDPLGSDHMLRAGFFALGDNFDNGSGTAHDYWDAPIWCDFPHQRWTPNPTHIGTGLDPTTVIASRVRWSFGPGTSGFMEVFAL